MSDLGDGHKGEFEREEVDPLGGHGDDAPPPASPGRRSIAGAIAFLFIAVIIAFLVWFIATHTDRGEGSSLVGGTDDSGGALSVAGSPHPFASLPAVHRVNPRSLFIAARNFQTDDFRGPPVTSRSVAGGGWECPACGGSNGSDDGSGALVATHGCGCPETVGILSRS